ncbi:hypothetical protein AZI86_10855 [Bdellovibrio bacteriovorus]|uniref:Peptidase S1 domain-containing protein n=1 Tax=Bdellovibrio bacteriovorus TaxID=959 RepID=A0A150WLD2_BDEBC|nr:trypsin-like serine protease [Bdellovibrio bacteriovorus]KYG64702.1 hypothetical protein AZI86_10855 [Bdellovibrio bacteriovorus]
MKKYLLSILLLSACAGPTSHEIAELEQENAIVGGKATPFSDPDLRSVVKIVDGFNRICTGTLIAEQIVLTAAHCVKDGGDLEIFFAADPKKSVMSAELIPHENYQLISEGVMKLKNEHKNDIGLIWLEKPAPKKAVPALMPETLTAPGSRTLHAVGYGRTSSVKNDHGVLRSVDLTAEIRSASPQYFFFDQSIGKGICTGDSGGPLFAKHSGQVSVVVGVVNGADDVDAFFGQPVEGDKCVYTGVGTQVAAYKDWIISTTEKLIAKHGVKRKSTFNEALSTDQALCRKPFPTHEAMKAEILAVSHSGAKSSLGVGGLAIKDENAKLIEAYRYLVTYKSYKFKPEQDIDFWTKFKDLKCDKALCAAEAVFGSEDGVLYLYVAMKYKIILSHLGFDRLKAPTPKDQDEFDAYFKVRPWSKAELGPYLNALTMLPAIQLPTYVRMNHSGILNPVNPNVLSNGIIQFYKPMDAMSDSHKEHTTFHEIAHNYGTFYGLDSSQEWLKASGWVEKEKHFINERPQEFVTDYASKDFFEDFAESFTYYRYYPQVLKLKSPLRYEYFKKTLYKGQEFLSVSDCK